MKLLLTSFGTTGLSDIAIPYNPVFYRMPPVRMVGKSKGVFVPDYSALLVCDKLVLDKSSFDVLCTNSHYSYRLIAETLNTLYREGFIELVNFDEILKSNAETLKQMLDYDLQIPDRWIKPLEESLLIWNDFSEDLPEIIQGKKEHILSEQYLHFAGHGLCHPAVPLESGLLWASDNNITQTDSASSLLHESVGTSKERQEFQRNDAIRKALSINLAYINANLVISSELETGLYDWRDFLPLYRQKFLSVGRKRIDGISHVEQLQRLFSVAFPEFTITDTATLMKVLKDKRIEELRFLVQNAVSGKVTFDEIFAKRVLRDVLNNERTLSKYRNLISYLTTMPLSLGNFLTESGSGIQEIETRVIKDALDKQKQYSWFYLLDESIGEASASENETMNFPGLSYEQDLLVQSGRGGAISRCHFRLCLV